MHKPFALPVTLVALGLLAVLLAPPIDGVAPVGTANAQVYKPHAPIKITHNNDFRAASNGVTGHGTSSSPYIIEGWEFTANASGADAATPAIWITGTSAFFVIRNCRFDFGADRIAVKFDDMSNGVVTENNFLGNKIALQFTRSANVDILKNKIEGSAQAGVVLIETGDIVTKANTFTANAVADMQLNTTEKGQILENTFTVKGIGVDFSEGSSLKVNNNQFNSAEATIGARINGMDSGEIKDNKFSGFTKWGLQVLRSNRGIIQNNEFANNGGADLTGGAAAEESSSLQFIGNKANNNKGRGIYLYATSQSWIKDGEANGNGNDGIELRYSSNDGIRNMQANDNQRAGINLNESSNNLVESNTVLRNKVRDNGSLIVGGNDNKVVKNEVAFSAGYGILITQWMSGNQVLANNLHDNKLEHFYSDSDPNANVFSSDENYQLDETDEPRGAGGLAPSAPFALVLLALLALVVVRRRR